MRTPLLAGLLACLFALVSPGLQANTPSAVPGCTDPSACNYNPEASEDDGSCEYFSCALLGCTDATACNYSPTAFFENGSCVYASGCDVCNGSAVVDGDADNDGVCNVNEISGCTTPGACNYTAAATDPGSCVFATGCDMCSGGAVVDGDADNDGVCNANEVVGCMQAAACNYNPAATDPAPCSIPAGCDICTGGAVASGDADGDGVCNANEVDGCTDPAAFNYSASATDEDGSCDYTADLPADWDFVPTPSSALVLGSVTLDGLPAAAGDIVGAFSPSGTCAGTAACIVYGGTAYLLLAVYGDDGTTAGVEGIWPGAPFTLKLFDASTGGVHTYVTAAGASALSGWANTNGAPLPGYSDPTFVFAFSSTAAPVLCGDASACNYSGPGAPLDACTYPVSGYGCDGTCLAPDACGICNGPGAIYACGCTALPPGACNCGGSTLDVLGVCGGTCTADADADGVCDSVDPCVGALDACGVCNGPGAVAACGCSGIPAGDCDCNGNALDALGVCGGTCAADADDDGVCDSEDPCVGVLDACGVCNGPGATYACGCSGLLPGTCDCSGTLPDALGICGGTCLADTDADGICDDAEPAGCTDPTACTYVCGATLDDGSCTYPAYGLACDGTCLVDSDGDGICEQDEIHGCTDPSGCNFDPAATEPNACLYPTPGRTCSGACLTDSDGDGVCNGDERPGCTNPTSPLFNPYATDPDPAACAFTCTPVCADLSGDHFVGTDDLLIMLSQYGSSCP
jgi:hypothetical protein